MFALFLYMISHKFTLSLTCLLYTSMRMGTSAGSYSRNGAAGMMGKCTVATKIREMEMCIRDRCWD